MKTEILMWINRMEWKWHFVRRRVIGYMLILAVLLVYARANGVI